MKERLINPLLREAGKKQKYDIREDAQKLGTDENTTKEMLRIQEKKQTLMNTLHEKLKEIDRGGAVAFEKNVRTVSQNEDGHFFVYGKRGIKIPLTFGDVARASIWGTQLKLDENVARKKKKEFALMETKRRIGALYDKQLALWGAHVDINTNTGKDEAYEAILARQEKSFKEIPNGVLAEKIIASYFTKMNYDHPELPFTFEVADVYEDVENKIDFIFTIKTHKRGMGVDVTDQREIGIQFTMNQKALERKQKQIANAKKSNELKVDDLVLVAMPIAQIREALTKWQGAGKNARLNTAPEDYLPQQTRKQIFMAIMEKLPQDLDIDPERCWRIAGAGDSVENDL